MSSNASSAAKKPVPFGKYLLLDRINIGGMAEVWRGKSFGAGGFERIVAIKRILPNIAEDEEFIAMFIDEAKITVQLTHSNVASIYELGHLQNSYFIAMEYIPGKDLRVIFERCRRKGEPAPVPLVCYVIAKLCEGLDYAHRKKDSAGRDMNIVHRDVSPQNVLISYEGEVKIIDFGIAKAAGKASRTQAGILKGKFGYMSPEQIRGIPVDHRSDIFAVGVCLYEVLTGERLFVGESDFSILEKVRTAEVLAPSTYNHKIPKALETIVLKALAKEPDERYQHANELGTDLQRFLITSDAIFSRKDLSQYMKATFAEDVEREKQKLSEYAEIKQDPADPSAVLPPAPSATAPPQIAPLPLTPLPPSSPAAPGFPPRQEAPASSPGSALLPPPPTRRSTPGVLPPPASAPSSPEITGEHSGAESTVMVQGGGYYPSMSPGSVEYGEPPTLASQPPSEGVNSSSPAAPVRRSTSPVAGGPVIPTTSVDLPRRPTGMSAAVPAPTNSDLSPLAPPTRQTAEPRRRSNPPPEREGDLQTTPDHPSAPGPTSITNTQTQGSRQRLWYLLVSSVGVLLAANLVTMIALLGPAAEGFVQINFARELAGRNVRINLDGTYLVEGRDFDLRRSPPLKRVKAGKTLMVVGADGYAEQRLVVTVKKGVEPTVVSPQLQRVSQAVRLLVLTQPQDADVTVNGEVAKTDTPGSFAQEIPVDTEAVIIVRKEGFDSIEKRVTPRSVEEPVRLALTLRPASFEVLVTSNPPGAVVTASGRNALGVTPAKLKVPAGLSELVLTKRCYESVSVPVRASSDPKSPTQVSGSLRRKPNCR